MRRKENMRRPGLLGFGLLGAVAALIASPGLAMAQETLKIGVPTALTGTYAGLGAEAVRAIEFAVAEANAKGGVAGHKVEIKKLRDSWNNKQPIEWVRIHSVARHVHFPHMRHIKVLGPNACQTCHGDVARMPQVFKVQNVNNMGFCITCHLQRKANRDCTACHY